ncbi:MAG: PepSY-associated TM helix domain-containing protein [Prevotella sp.]|jgi:uncharacterized iron-regulated membrane protein
MKQAIRKIHLYLGLFSGIIVMVIALTGALYAFADEIQTAGMNRARPGRDNTVFLPPDLLAAKVRTQLTAPATTILGITYRRPLQTAKVTCADTTGNRRTLLVSPYTGQVVGHLHAESFFHWVIRGHRSLWLPPAVGSWVVGISTSVFVMVLLTGLWLWIPKRWSISSVMARLSVKWKGSADRRIYDLHNSLGLYILLITLPIALTGITWSFAPLSRLYYRALTGKELTEWNIPQSDTLARPATTQPARILWQRIVQHIKPGTWGSLRFDFPQTKDGIYLIAVNPDVQRYYRQQYLFFDRYTLRRLPGGGVYGLSPDRMTTGDRIFRMSYDIHSGSIASLPGRLIVMIGSLLLTTLPVTGFLLWYRRTRRKSRQLCNR